MFLFWWPAISFKGWQWCKGPAALQPPNWTHLLLQPSTSMQPARTPSPETVLMIPRRAPSSQSSYFQLIAPRSPYPHRIHHPRPLLMLIQTPYASPNLTWQTISWAITILLIQSLEEAEDFSGLYNNTGSWYVGHPQFSTAPDWESGIAAKPRKNIKIVLVSF